MLAPCTPNPCENAAVCKESPNFESYTCLCAPGWQGNRTGVEEPKVLNKVVSQVIRWPGKPRACEGGGLAPLSQASLGLVQELLAGQEKLSLWHACGAP